MLHIRSGVFDRELKKGSAELTAHLDMFVGAVHRISLDLHLPVIAACA